MDFAQQVSGVAALDNEVTRSVYRLLLGQPWVSRDDASEALGVARSVAAFHLDKLVEAGLATARFERVSGRTGPGAGRPSKLYGRSAVEIDLSLPSRRYALAGAVLADAVVLSEADGIPIADSVASAARATGKGIGAGAQGDLAALLSEHGYEPQVRDDEIALHNCPFHALAERHRGLVCSLNLNLLDGVVEGAGCQEQVRAVLHPEPGMCCVRLRARP